MAIDVKLGEKYKWKWSWSIEDVPKIYCLGEVRNRHIRSFVLGFSWFETIENYMFLLCWWDTTGRVKALRKAMGQVFSSSRSMIVCHGPIPYS